MKAVNLVPGDSRRGRVGVGSPSVGPGIAVLVLLAVAVAFVTLYVVTTNSISDRKAELADVRGQITQQQALASRLANYAAFAKLAQTQADSVRTIVQSRFDWHSALSDIARVFPASTSLTTLFGSASSSSSVSGASGSAVGGSAASLRGADPGPAFEFSGCTKTQEDVAGLISRLRVVPGVTRVTLGDSVKHVSAAGSPSSGPPACGNGPSFDLVVFFKAPPGSVPATPGSTAVPTSSTSTTSATTTTTTTAAATTTTTGAGTPTP